MMEIIKIAETVAAVHTHTHTHTQCYLSNEEGTSGALFGMNFFKTGQLLI